MFAAGTFDQGGSGGVQERFLWRGSGESSGGFMEGSGENCSGEGSGEILVAGFRGGIWESCGEFMEVSRGFWGELFRGGF